MNDLNWVLAHFAFVANATTLANMCDIVHSPGMSVASCRVLPQTALAFIGDSPKLLATYAAFLADPGSQVELVVNVEQLAVARSAFNVQSVVPKWQMVFRGDAEALPATKATELADNDLAAMQSLAQAEQFTMRLFTEDILQFGPAYGIWARRRLVAMGTTNAALPVAAQIGNVLTHSDYRRQGYGSDIISALVRAHHAAGRCAFIIVDQGHSVAIHLFEKLGFVRERAMYAIQCLLKPAEKS